MKQKHLKLIPLLLFSCGIAGVNAQQNVLTAGGEATGTGGKASYSIGQIDYIAFKSAGNSVSQGVQHAFVAPPLPVTLLNFKATKQEQKVLLNWETASEVNSNKFVVQRSKDGLSFLNIGEKAAAGNSNVLKQYAIEDLQPLKGWNYYRIKQVDRDGSALYSKIISINFKATEAIAVIYPNPTKQNIVLKVTNINGQMLSYQLYDDKGSLVLQNKIISNETNIRVTNFSAGIYSLKIIGQNNNTIKTFQIIKSN